MIKIIKRIVDVIVLLAFLYVLYILFKMGIGIFSSPEKTSMSEFFGFFMDFIKLQLFLFVLFALRKFVNKFHDRMIEKELNELSSYEYFEE